MTQVVIRRCAFSDLEQAAAFPELQAQYAAESGLEGLPQPAAHLETYRLLDKVDTLHVLSAWIDDRLIGFLLFLTPILPHYSTRVATSESYFVAPEYRKSGAGLKLLRAAEAWALELGSNGLLISAPSGSRLSEVMPRVGYRESNQVFFKSLA